VYGELPGEPGGMGERFNQIEPKPDEPIAYLV
jgi:hypothetical protein